MANHTEKTSIPKMEGDILCMHDAFTGKNIIKSIIEILNRKNTTKLVNLDDGMEEMCIVAYINIIPLIETSDLITILGLVQLRNVDYIIYDIIEWISDNIKPECNNDVNKFGLLTNILSVIKWCSAKNKDITRDIKQVKTKYIKLTKK